MKPYSKIEHDKFLRRIKRWNLGDETIQIFDFPIGMTGRQVDISPTSDTIPSNGFKKSIDDYRWKRGRQESTQAILEIERKRKRIAPAYNKGANQYITEGADTKTLGRKI